MIIPFLISLGAFAQSTLKPQLVPDEIFESHQAKISQELSLTKKRQELRVLTQYAQTNFTQSGQGTTFETGKTNSLGILLQHDYSLNEKNLLRTDLSFQPSGFKNPTTNKTQTVTRTFLASHFGRRGKLGSVRTELLVGAVVGQRSGFTDAQNLSSSSLSLAPSVGAVTGFELNQQVSLHASVFVNSPIWLREEKKTGIYENGLSTTARTGLSLSLSKRLRVSIEAMFEQEVLNFSGQGDRSIKDARLTYRALSFPIGVEYEF